MEIYVITVAEERTRRIWLRGRGDERKIERQGINGPKYDKSVLRCNFKMSFSETTVCFHTALISWCCEFNGRKVVMKIGGISLMT